ncbi:MAG: cation-translocating P-type ATPase [Promethearchaeia archaeon]
MTASCSHSSCELDSELMEEEESYFEEHFWKFTGSAAILLGVALISEIIFNLLMLSQILAGFSILFSGSGILREAIENIKDRKISVNILMIIAAIASFFILHGQEGATAIMLYSIAEYIEDKTVDKSRDAIKELYELAPDESLLKVGSSYKAVPTSSIEQGQIVGIKPGMKVPLDGIIIKGDSYFDESAITGESVPVLKEEGEEIYAGTINSNSFVDIEVIREAGDTIVAKIAERIKIAQQNKSSKERFIEKFAKYYTPLILLISLVIMIFPPLLFGSDFNTWFYRGLILLVISCPCALTLSTPLSMISSLTKLAKEGILVKGNRFIEALEDIDVFAFDKTGTITEGKLKVFQIIELEKEDVEILQIAASLELLSEHPIAGAIVAEAKRKELSLLDVQNFSIIKGKGIKGEIDGILYYVGSQRFFNDLNLDLPEDILADIENQGTIPLLVGTSNNILGIITIRDVLRITSPILIEGLKNKGYETIIISGDNQQVCNTIGKCLDVDYSRGELLPEEKLKEIENLKKNKKNVAMVGDGVNDAPALALSDLGIAIGASATDITLETSDIIIMNDDLTKILTLVDIADKTNRIIKENIWVSIIVKVTFAVLTVLGLMTLWLAVGIGDMGVSLLVMANSLRIFRYKYAYKKISPEMVETEAKMIVCDRCETKKLIPQHHGRDMIKEGEQLVCWKRLLNGNKAEVCKEELELECPQCGKTRILS